MILYDHAAIECRGGHAVGAEILGDEAPVGMKLVMAYQPRKENGAGEIIPRRICARAACFKFLFLVGLATPVLASCLSNLSLDHLELPDGCLHLNGILSRFSAKAKAKLKYERGRNKRPDNPFP